MNFVSFYSMWSCLLDLHSNLELNFFVFLVLFSFAMIFILWNCFLWFFIAQTALWTHKLFIVLISWTPSSMIIIFFSLALNQNSFETLVWSMKWLCWYWMFGHTEIEFLIFYWVLLALNNIFFNSVEALTYIFRIITKSTWFSGILNKFINNMCLTWM